MRYYIYIYIYIYIYEIEIDFANYALCRQHYTLHFRYPNGESNADTRKGTEKLFQ